MKGGPKNIGKRVVEGERRASAHLCLGFLFLAQEEGETEMKAETHVGLFLFPPRVCRARTGRDRSESERSSLSPLLVSRAKRGEDRNALMYVFVHSFFYWLPLYS